MHRYCGWLRCTTWSLIIYTRIVYRLEYLWNVCYILYMLYYRISILCIQNTYIYIYQVIQSDLLIPLLEVIGHQQPFEFRWSFNIPSSLCYCFWFNNYSYVFFGYFNICPFGGFNQSFVCTFILGEMIQFDSCVSNCSEMTQLVSSPTAGWMYISCELLFSMLNDSEVIWNTSDSTRSGCPRPQGCQKRCLRKRGAGRIWV